MITKLLMTVFCTIGGLFWVESSYAQVVFSTPHQDLAKLSIASPAAYRDLAEEYSVARKSKTAKDLSVRLYLIAAKHGEGKLRRSALRGLMDVARNEEELQKFKVLAYLSDPVFADLLLKKDPQFESLPRQEFESKKKRRQN